MSNNITEMNGIQAVVKYEKTHGRTQIRRVHKCGYDLISKGNGDERHIEVKTTEKVVMAFRWLEQLEYDVMKCDENWYLYIVTRANGANPRIYEYNRKDAEKRFSKVVQHYLLNFPKSDFK